jgi:hypothetical protein
MELRNTSISIHYSRLSNIVQSPYKSISSFNKNFINIVNRKKFNHVKIFLIFRQNGKYFIAIVIKILILESISKI